MAEENIDADIKEMKKQLNIELACEQVFTPSAPPLYPTLHIYDSVPVEPIKTASQSNNSHANPKLFVTVFAIWTFLGLSALAHSSSEDLKDITRWYKFNLDSKNVYFLASSNLVTATTSALFLVILRKWSKAFLYFFIAVMCVTAFALMLLTVFLFHLSYTHGVISIGLEALMSLLGTLFVAQVPCIIGKKEIDELSVILRDSFKAMICFPYAVLIKMLVSILLVIEFINFQLVFLVECKLEMLNFLMIAMNISAFLWIIFITLDLGYLALTTIFLLSKTTENRSSWTCLLILAEIQSTITNGFKDIVYGSSHMSILKYAAIMGSMPFKLTNFACGLFFLLSRLFNNGAYTIHIMKKKNFSPSAKMIADTLFKNPMKYAIYIIVGAYFSMMLLTLSFFNIHLLCDFIWGYDFVTKYGGSPGGLPIFYTFFTTIAILGSLMSAFYTMMVHHLITTTDVELINLGFRN